MISSRRLMKRISAAGLTDVVASRVRAKPWLDATSAVSELATESEAVSAALFDIPLPEPGISTGFASDNFERGFTYSSGLQNLRTVDGAWRRHRHPQPEYRVLDFGSGTGRLLRFACELGEGVTPVGSEVNPDAVAWLRSNFPCEVLSIAEPSLGGLGGLKFDLIYAWSIFSHFNEASHVDWLSCLAEALNPGGMLFATVYSVNNSKRLEEDEAYRDHFRMSLSDVDRLVMEAEGGFSFFEGYDTDESAHHGIDAKRFGQAFVSEDFLRTTWSRFGVVREIGEAMPGWQDYVLLQTL